MSTQQINKQNNKKQQLPNKLPNSIYAIVAIPLLADKDHLNLEQIKIIGRNADALKFGAYYDTKKQKLYGPSQYFDYKEILTPNDYYQFILDYLDDNEQTQFNNEQPCKLTKQWYVYKSYARAMNQVKYLREVQDKSYDSLLLVAKAQIDKHQIVVVDLLQLMADFIRRKLMPDILHSPDFIKHFQHNMPIHNDKLNQSDSNETKQTNK